MNEGEACKTYEGEACKTYECEACQTTTPSRLWGPGWITCPRCGFVARTVYEKAQGLRLPSEHLANRMEPMP